MCGLDRHAHPDLLVRHPEDQSQAAEASKAGLDLTGFELEHVGRTETRLQRQCACGQTLPLTQLPHGRTDAGSRLDFDLDHSLPLFLWGTSTGGPRLIHSVAVVQVRLYLVAKCWPKSLMSARPTSPE